MNALRPASPDDAPILASLHAECFEQAWDRSAFESLLATPGTRALLAEADEKPRGFVLLRAVAGEAEILSIGVRPGCRRLGLAGLLLRGAAREAIRLEAAEMFLEVEDGNLPAQALYAAHGFRKVGNRPSYYVDLSGAMRNASILRATLPFAHSGMGNSTELD